MAGYIVEALVYKMAYLFKYSSEQFQTLVVVLKANLRVMKKIIITIWNFRSQNCNWYMDFIIRFFCNTASLDFWETAVESF